MALRWSSGEVARQRYFAKGADGKWRIARYSFSPRIRRTNNRRSGLRSSEKERQMASVEKGAAIVMRQYGAPDVLRLETISLPPLQSDEIRIRSAASAINHSDLEIRAGNWPILKSNPFPYTPGLEVVGLVEEIGGSVSDVSVGDQVITMMQGLGGVHPQRPGGYAEYATVRSADVAVFPKEIEPLDMAALGLGSVTAFEALQKIGDLRGRRVVVTGAAGGVGSAAVAIAKAQGADVIGLISNSAQEQYVRSLGASKTISAQDIDAGALEPETVDGVLDTVAGKSFKTYVTALRKGGVLSLVGAVGGSDVSFDAYRLTEITLTGYASDTLDGAGLRSAVTAIAGWLGRSEFRAPDRTVLFLDQAAVAHSKLEQHLVRGRVILIPRDKRDL
jgi:NADPH:quinone reductase